MSSDLSKPMTPGQANKWGTQAKRDLRLSPVRATVAEAQALLSDRGKMDRVAAFNQELMEDMVLGARLLKKTASVDVPAIDHFSADKIRVGRVEGVPIVFVGHDYMQWFGGKVELDTEAITLQAYLLRQSSSDASIFRALHGEGVGRKTMIGQIFWLMQRQADGRPSFLSTYAWNRFYVDDAKGITREVSARWSQDFGWYVYARPVDSCQWYASYQVVSG